MRTLASLSSAIAGAVLLAVAAVQLPYDARTADLIPGLSMSGSGDLGLLALTAIASGVLFTAWPWAVLPTAIVGVLATTDLLGDSSVRSILGVHGFLLAAGCASLAVRRLFARTGDLAEEGQERDARYPTVADFPMALVVVLLAAAAAYGLLLGHPPLKVLISAYHFAVIPAYFFLATYTLNTPGRLRSAYLLFVILSAVLTVVSLAAPGRHGGAWSLLAAFPLLALSCRTRGWARIGLVGLAALFLADLVLASYRTIWALAGVAVLVLLVRGTAAIRWAAGTMVAATGLSLAAAITVSAGVRERATEIMTAVEQGAGYRLPEAMVGLDVFRAHPLVGAGLGQSTPDVYIPDFQIADVGPLYHVFYVMILANLGLVGLAVLLWPILRTLRAGLAERNGVSFAFAALLCGFLVSVLFSGPATGHWALGLLPALILLTRSDARLTSPAQRSVSADAVAPAGSGAG